MTPNQSSPGSLHPVAITASLVYWRCFDNYPDPLSKIDHFLFFGLRTISCYYSVEREEEPTC
jgi:hypothetical protein